MELCRTRMTSSRSRVTHRRIHIFVFLLLITLLVLLLSRLHFSDNQDQVEAAIFSAPGMIQADQKVNLTLYYETLCPHCSDFIINRLPVLFASDVIAIVNLRLVPWGNARVDDDRHITCQHGSAECYLNAVEACAIDAWPERHFTFIACVERLAMSDSISNQVDREVWKDCCEELELNPELITYCYGSGNGKQLVIEHGKETFNLDPRIEYVPWVVVNDKPLRNEYVNFITHVCNAYRGSPKPAGCSTR